MCHATFVSCNDASSKLAGALDDAPSTNMTQPRHRHRGASYVASASDGIIKTSHKVYASSSDDDSPAGFLQAAYDPNGTPPASPRCAPRRQVTYSVTESEEDVSESPDAFVVELTRSENFWTQRVRWYPDDCFGPYRAERLGYSRRELCADAVVHLVGIVAFSAGAGALLHACCVHEPSVETTVSLLLYVCSLLTMLGCSFLCGNQTPGAPRHRRDVVPVTASDNLTHWLISTQVRSSSTARRGRGGTCGRCSSRTTWASIR